MIKSDTPTAIVVAGATGDLAHKKIFPALQVLFKKGLLHPDSCVIGTGRSCLSHTEFRESFDLPVDFLERCFYHSGFDGLKECIEKKGCFKRVVFFLALPPSAYAKTVKLFQEDGFGKESIFVIEKPFGYDLQSAKELHRELNEQCPEDRIFRIDHYLGKEAIQNILVFRFANALFEPIWNSHHIESIQINAYETIGVGSRGAYYDGAGAIRDMVQNHLTQLLALLTMDPPLTLTADDIQSKKLEILKQLKVEEVHRFQYNGYLDERGVSPNSQKETFAELRLSLNNFRWSGVPIYIRAGKAMPRTGTEIGVTFKSLPPLLYKTLGNIENNKIIFKIQPAEGIIIDMTSKLPGTDMELSRTNFSFCYRSTFSQEIPEAYQKLLLDAIKGDKSLFVSAEESFASWAIYDSILDRGELKTYEKQCEPETQMGMEWIDFSTYSDVCQ